MAALTPDPGSQLTNQGRTKKHKDKSGNNQHSQYPAVDPRERKKMAKARLREERKKADAAKLKASNKRRITTEVTYTNSHILNDNDKGLILSAEPSRAVDVDDSTREAHGDRDVRISVKEQKSKSKKHRLEDSNASATSNRTLFEGNKGRNLSEISKKSSKSKSKTMKHKLDNLDPTEATSTKEAAVPINLFTNKENQTQNKKRKIQRSKLQKYAEDQKAPPKTVLCTKCGTIGHIAGDCVLGVVCFNCKQVGHDARDCLQARKCHICHDEDHIAKDCVVLFDRDRPSISDNTREVIMIIESPVMQPKKHPQESPLDVVGIPQLDPFMEDKPVTRATKKEEQKTYLIPARLLTLESPLTKEAALIASITKFSPAKSNSQELAVRNDSSDESHSADIRPTKFIRNSFFMNERKESPIVPPGKSYRFQGYGSPTSDSRVAPPSRRKEMIVAPPKKIRRVDLAGKKSWEPEKVARELVTEEGKIGSSESELQIDSDNDESYRLQIYANKVKKARNSKEGTSKSPKRTIQDTKYHSSDSSSDSNSDSEVEGQQEVLKYKSSLPAPKKETPIPPPISLSSLRNSSARRSTTNFTPVVNPTPALKSSNPKQTTDKRVPLNASATLSPTPIVQKSVSAANASVPDWIMKPLARINSAIKASRESEEGWTNSPLRGGSKPANIVANNGATRDKHSSSRGRDEEEQEVLEMKVIADDWEKNPGRVRGGVGGGDGDVVENIAFSPLYIFNRPHGVTISSTTFLTLHLSASSPPQVLSHLDPNELMICAVADLKVQVTLAGTRFSVSKGGMWRVRGGEDCTVRHAGKAVRDAVVMAFRVREGFSVEGKK